MNKTKRKPVEPPEELAPAMRAKPSLRSKWDALSPSNQKEYAVWITGAKKLETRARRLADSVKLLAAGTRTPHRSNDAPATSVAPLAKKLGIKPGARAVVLGAPTGQGIGALPEGATLSVRGKGEVVLAYAQTSNVLAGILPKAIAAAQETSSVWIAFPKKSSKLPSDLGRDENWVLLEKIGWRFVSLIAVDADWSAVRIKPIA